MLRMTINNTLTEHYKKDIRMRAIVKSTEGVAIWNMPAPKPARGEVLVRVKLAGLCRTDVFVAEGRIPSKPDIVLGHEFSGIVADTGAETDGFRPGDRVTAMPV